MSRIAVAASTWGLEPEWDWVPERSGEEVIAAAAASAIIAILKFAI